MLILAQGISAIAGATLVALLFAGDANPPPIGVYIIAAAASGAAGTWLYARLRFGKDAVIRGSRRID